MTPPQNRTSAGLVLGGRYTLLAPIARGGMGEVWKARDQQSGRLVAAKVLRAELSGDELYLSRLRIEADNAMRVQHPNIANVQDSGEDNGRGWIIMELVTGRPLTDYLRDGARIAPVDLIPILIQMAMALGAAANAEVVHRDIKPANVLVRPDGRVKLTDFGISRAAEQVELTAAGMVMGTAQYLPPEQAMGERATPLGDLYALGVIAYEAVAGRRPFKGDTQVAIAFAHVNSPVPPLPESVPQPLANVILHLLEKKPEDRPESGMALVRELSKAARDMGVTVIPHPLPDPPPAPSRVAPGAPQRSRRRRSPDAPVAANPVDAGAKGAPEAADPQTTAPGNPPRPAAPASQRPAPVIASAQAAESATLPGAPIVPAAPASGAPAVHPRSVASSPAALVDDDAERRRALREKLRRRADARAIADAERTRRAHGAAKAAPPASAARAPEPTDSTSSPLASIAPAPADRPTPAPAPSIQSAPAQSVAAAPALADRPVKRSTPAPSSHTKSAVERPPAPPPSVGPEQWYSLSTSRRSTPMASPFRTNYSRSIVAPKIPRTRYIGLAVLIIAAIVLMAVVFVTIHNRFGSPQSLIDWGTNSIKEVRTWQIPWPAV